MENRQINMFALPQELNAVNELKLTYKRHEELLPFRDTELNSSKAIASFLRELFDRDDLIIRETFYAIYLDQTLRIVGFQKISEGAYDFVLVETRMIYTTALLSRATNVVIAHNHPSGTLSPSPADKKITKDIKDGLKLLNITLADHIILTETNHYSFRDDGQI